MLMIWDDFVKKEELESSPGVIDEDRVRALTLNTYLTYIKDMIDMGYNRHPDVVSEQMEDVMMEVFVCQTHTFEDRYPEPDEIAAFLRKRENYEARMNLTTLCVNSTAENWPEAEKQLKEMVPFSDLEKIVWDSEERKQCAEKWRKRFEQDDNIRIG